MKLSLVRSIRRADCTIGHFYIDGVFTCFSLEDMVRDPGVKVYGQTAIPYGTYQVVLTHSPRFKRVLPLLSNVPGFTGIRIHPGNTAEDTEGCILLGMQVKGNTIVQSRVAFDAVFAQLQAAEKRGEPVFIDIQELT